MTIYVTFHGGQPTKDIRKPIWYVVSYALVNGTWQSNSNALNLPEPSGEYAADGYELRDIQLASDGNFYVVNSYKHASEIWQIPSAGLAPGTNPAVFTSGATVPAIDHPFGLAFDSKMQVCYISAQDTNVVVAVHGPGQQQSGAALPVNSKIPGSHFLAGTFVASKLGIAVPPGSLPAPSDVRGSDGGLHCLPKSGPPLSNSARGVALIGATLYVADEPGNEVKTFDTTSGAYLGTVPDQNQEIKSPVHLLAASGTLYISTKDSVFSYDPATRKLAALLTGLNTPSGMSFDAAGNFYLASRKGQSISSYNSRFQPISGSPLISGLNDDPEFLFCAG